MSGDGLNATHLGAIHTEALIRSCRTYIHRLMIPHEWSLKLSAFWKPSSFFEEITSRTNQAEQFTLQLRPVPDALLASHGLPFSDKLCSPVRSLSDAVHGLTDLDPRSKPYRNKPLHQRLYLPAFLSDQH
ncbi:hypothetical protein CRENBAI_023720, partial [Crenichthys baileyi]